MITSKEDFYDYVRADRMTNHAPKRYKNLLLCSVQSGVNVSEGVVGGNHIYLSAGAKVLIVFI